MPRPLRIQYLGARYHVMSRGDGREAIFYDDADRVEFLRTLGQACRKTGWQVHAYCLMNNHFHLVLETPQPNLALGMKWLLAPTRCGLTGDTKLSGHLFALRHKSLLIDGATSGYSRTVCDYVHLNPVRARLLRKRERLQKAPLEQLSKLFARTSPSATATTASGPTTVATEVPPVHVCV
jgi:putative transposase